MIAQIVPAVRLPGKASQTYDYSIPKNLASAVKPGSVVVIPFAGRKVGGLVVSISKTATHAKQLKEIHGLAQGLSPLPPYIVEHWTKLAKIFATTLPRFVWAALPTIPARSISVIPSEARDLNASDPAQGFLVLDKTTSRTRNDNDYIFINNPNEALKAVKDAMREAGDQQVLILVPTVDEAMAWSKTLGGISIFHSALSVGAKYDLACAAANGALKAVVGTKSAVFLPMSNLGRIIIISAGSSSHLQEDQDPRFDARVIAMELAKASGAKLTCLDALLPLGLTPASNEPRSFTPIVHDLHDAAKAARSRVLISDELQTAIDESVAAGKRVLVLLNRRGVSTAQVCQNCGTVIACPDCGIPLIVHRDRSSCPSCERLYPLPDFCPKCDSADLKAIGSGSKTLFEMLKKRHPAASIAHVDRDSWQSDLNAAQIVVGTTAVFGSLAPDPKPFDLVADALMGAGQAKSGIWSTEASARILRTLGSLLAADGDLHVQTFDPIAPALKALIAPREFIKTELDERQAFGYPPAKTLVTIYGAGATEDALWEQATDLVEMIKSHVPRATCYEPTWSRPKLFRGKYRLTIAAKFGSGQNYDDLIQYLPAGFAAGVNLL